MGSEDSVKSENENINKAEEADETENVNEAKEAGNAHKADAADKIRSKKQLCFDILKLVGVFAALLAFFSGLFYAFEIEMEVRTAVPFALFFEAVAIVLLVIKRKKPAFPLKRIVGILIIVVGLGSAAIPFIAQSVTAKRQKDMIHDIEAYFDSMEKKEASPESGQAATTTAAETETTTNTAMQKDKEVVDNLKKQNIYGIIEIPSLDVRYAIVQGTETTNLRSAVGHMTEGVDAGQEGNCIIAGHRGGYYGTFFKDIDKLENGAEILVTDLESNTYTYVVYEQKWIKPYDWFELDGIPGEKTLTLLSCEEEGELRIIVRARIVE